MLGLAVAYLWGKDHGRQQAVAADDAGSGLGLVGFCGAVGAVIGGATGNNADAAVGTGFFWGLGVGVTLWLVGAAWLTGRGWGILATAVVGGTWLGFLTRGADGIVPGAAFGAAVWVGWLLSLIVLAVHVQSLTDADEVA